MKQLKVEYIHDICCSWCPINYSYLQQCLLDLEDLVVANFNFLPYELSPSMPASGEKIRDFFRRVNGWSDKEHDAYRANLLSVSSAAGVNIDFSKRTRYYNTSLAHRLMHWAETHGLQKEVNEKLIESYFTYGVDVSDLEKLLEVVGDLGLDKNSARKELHRSDMPNDLRKKYERARRISKSGVPVVVFNGTKVVNGVSSVSKFKDIVLRELYDDAVDEPNFYDLIFL